MADMWICHQKRGSIVGFVVSSHLVIECYFVFEPFLLLRNRLSSAELHGEVNTDWQHIYVLDIITRKNCKGKMVFMRMLIYF